MGGSPTLAHIVTTLGLLIDIGGATFLAWGLFLDEEKALHLGLSRPVSPDRKENLVQPAVLDRLRQSRDAKIGLVLLIWGFLLQVVGTWTNY
jgi:hypothetical protein